jgi:hypothetical protein
LPELFIVANVEQNSYFEKKSRIKKRNVMSRNNEGNIKKHNDKLHKAQDKAKKAAMDRKEKLKQITKKFNEGKSSENN